MKYLMFLSFLAALFFISMIVLNVHDFLYVPELPWREGEFKSSLLICVVGFLVFAIFGFGFWNLARQRERNRRAKEWQKSD